MRTTNFRHLFTTHSLPLFLFSVGCILAGCGDNPVDPFDHNEITEVRGVVTDEEGNTYPGVAVTLQKTGSDTIMRSETTDFAGVFEFERISAGSYLVAIEPPRESEVVETNPTDVEVSKGKTSQLDIEIRTLPIEGTVWAGSIRNASGNQPSDPTELLYHANDPEQLHPITAPDGDHVRLSEWRDASGTARVTCGGRNGTHHVITMDGLIPNGVYSVGAVLTEFTNAPVRIGTGVLGRADGSENAFTASASGEGRLEVTLRPGPMSLNGEAPDCVLTQVAVATLWLFYHIDGRRDQGSRMSWVEHLRIKI